MVFYMCSYVHIHTCTSVLSPSAWKSWHSQLQWPPLWSNKLITVLIQSSFLFLLELQLALPSQFFNKQSSLSSSLNLFLSILQALRVCEWDGCAVWVAPHVVHTHRSCSSHICTCHMSHDMSILDTRHLFKITMQQFFHGMHIDVVSHDTGMQVTWHLFRINTMQ